MFSVFVEICIVCNDNKQIHIVGLQNGCSLCLSSTVFRIWINYCYHTKFMCDKSCKYVYDMCVHVHDYVSVWKAVSASSLYDAVFNSA